MEEVYAVYLVEVADGKAAYLTSTRWVRRVDDLREVREPSTLSATKFNEWMISLDSRVSVIRDEAAYRSWIESGSGWAAIDGKLAGRLMPQWFNHTSECMYVRIVEGVDFFADVNSVRDVLLLSRQMRLFGTDVGDKDWLPARVILSDLVLMSCQV